MAKLPTYHIVKAHGSDGKYTSYVVEAPDTIAAFKVFSQTAHRLPWVPKSIEVERAHGIVTAESVLQEY